MGYGLRTLVLKADGSYQHQGDGGSRSHLVREGFYEFADPFPGEHWILFFDRHSQLRESVRYTHEGSVLRLWDPNQRGPIQEPVEYTLTAPG
jgi:hypothetical protein